MCYPAFTEASLCFFVFLCLGGLIYDVNSDTQDLMLSSFELFFFINRFGQRTIQGILKDGWNALMRYYLNNFIDGTKQVCMSFLFRPIGLQTSVMEFFAATAGLTLTNLAE